MIKAVIFDLDNTLIDFMRMKKASCEEAMNAMIDAGLDIEKGKALKILFDLYQEYGIEDKQIFQKFLKKTIGRIDWKILSAGVVAYRRVKAGYLAPYPGVVSTLIALKHKNIKTAIVSDAPRMRAWLRLASMKLSDFFDVVITFEDTGMRKPSKKPFEAALRKLKLSPSEVLMIGDWAERDIAGAKKLGMKTCFARYGDVKKTKNSGADYDINHIRELLAVVEKENA